MAIICGLASFATSGCTGVAFFSALAFGAAEECFGAIGASFAGLAFAATSCALFLASIAGQAFLAVIFAAACGIDIASTGLTRFDAGAFGGADLRREAALRIGTGGARPGGFEAVSA